MKISNTCLKFRPLLFLAACFLGGVLISGSAGAAGEGREDWRELKDFLDLSLKAQTSANLEIDHLENRSIPDYPDFESWVYHQYQLRIKGTVGISLHWLLKVEFLPELETVWTQ